MNKKGFLIYNKISKLYCEDYLEPVEDFQCAWLYDNFDDAKEEIENADTPDDYEIHECEFNLNVLMEYGREIKWNLIRGQVK